MSFSKKNEIQKNKNKSLPFQYYRGKKDRKLIRTIPFIHNRIKENSSFTNKSRHG